MISFDTAGNPTTQFQWKNADGSTITSLAGFVKLVPYGGSLYILRKRVRNEIWVYDGSGCRLLAELPIDFGATDMCVSNGVVFVAGLLYLNAAATTSRPQLYYYINGSIGKLWESDTTLSVGRNMSVQPFGNGVIFLNPVTGNILQYDLGLGGVHTITNNPNTGGVLVASNGTSSFLMAGSGGSSYGYPSSSISYASTGYIQTSQYDFDNTLTKVFRGIKVDADIPANTSIDIAYQLDGCGGTYTTLQTGALSGTEYPLPNNTTGHSISVQVTLKSATGAATPTLKRVYVRAAPTLQQFRKREYLFDISSGTRDEIGKSSRRTRDGFVYPKDAITACNDLIKIATQTVPFTVYDRFVPGGMTVLADLQQNQAGYDGFAIYEVEPNVYIGRINLREV